jgi:hypothetical protein
MRAPVVKGVNATLVIDDQDGSMRPAYYEAPFGIEFRKRACTHEFDAHDRASFPSAALGMISECGHVTNQDCNPPTYPCGLAACNLDCRQHHRRHCHVDVDLRSRW